MKISRSPSVGDVNVGARIRLARKKAGLTLVDLGKITNISYQQISKYERGKNRISPSRLQAIANMTSHSIGFFFATDGTQRGTDEAIQIVRLMARGEAFRRIIATLPQVMIRDVEAVADFVEHLANKAARHNVRRVRK